MKNIRSNENMEDGSGWTHLSEGRPKLRWSDVTKKYTKEKQVKIEETQDGRTWRLKTRCADPK